MKVDEKTPAKVLETFLNSIDAIIAEYNIAQSIVETEEKRLQDLLHAVEFARTRKERDKVTTRLHNSRKLRRENKNKVLLYEPIIKFYNEKNNKDALNRMRQLLGQQRKNEEKVNREKIYTPRIEDEYLDNLINGKEDKDGEAKI